MNELIRFRWLALILLLVATAGVLRGLETAMVPDNAMNVWFLDSDPALEQYREFQQRFGNDEVALVHIQFPQGVYTPAAITTLQNLGVAITELSGVERVYSVANTAALTSTSVGPTIASVVAENPDDPGLLASIAKSLQHNPLVVGQLVNAAADQAILWIEMEVSDNFDARRDSIVASIRRSTDRVLTHQVYHVAGIGVLYSGLNEVTEQDFATFLGLSFLLLFAMMAWILRSLLFTFTAILVIILSMLLMFGIFGSMGKQINMVTSMLPIIVMVLGIADIVHFPAAYARERRANPDNSATDIAIASLRQVVWPCVLTTVTTAAGFLALVSAPMAVVRDLGLFAAIGVATALLASLVLMPIAFLLIRDPLTLPSHRLIDAFFDRCRQLVHRPDLFCWALFALMAAVAIIGVSRIEVDSYTLGYLPDSHQVVTDHKAIEESWGAYNILEFIVHPAAGYSIEDPALLAAMNQFVQRAKQDPRIRDGLSLDTFYRQLVAGIEDNEPLSAQQLESISESSLGSPHEWDRSKPGFRDNALAAFRNEDNNLGRIKLVGDMLSANQLSDLLQQMSRLSEETMANLGSIEASGYLPLYTKIIDYVMTSQIRSFALALGIIFLVLLLGLRSARLALISLPANLFPVLIMFAVMGYAGIDLDIATASIAAIVIGVSVDDTVHFLWAWREAERRGMGWPEALDYSYEHAGRAAVITSILLVSGYAVLMAGSGTTVFYFGLLTTVAAAAALVGDLLLLPLLLKPFSRQVTI